MRNIIVLFALSLAAFGCNKGDEAAKEKPAAPASKEAAPASKAEEAPKAAEGDKAEAAEGDKAEGDTAKAAEANPEAVAAAKEKFTTLCATCHGPDGKGDGPASAALDPKPRSFGDAEWQKSVTDEHISKVIVGGGTAVGMSPLMTPNPDLAAPEKAEVLAELVKIVRSYAP